MFCIKKTLNIGSRVVGLTILGSVTTAVVIMAVGAEVLVTVGDLGSKVVKKAQGGFSIGEPWCYDGLWDGFTYD